MTKQEILDAIEQLSRAGVDVDINTMYAAVLGAIARNNELDEAEKAALEEELSRKYNELLRRQIVGEPADSDVASATMSEPTVYSPEQLKQYQDATVATQPSRPSSEVDPLDYYRRDSAFDVLGAADDVAGDDVVSDGDVPGGVPTPSVTFGTAANQAEVERILAEQFGGFSFFLNKYDDKLQVGVTATGEIVSPDDPNALTTKHVVDVMVEQGIVDSRLIKGLIEKTQWYQTTDAKMREHDVLVANMTDLEEREYLDPVLDILRKEATFLGVDLSDEAALEYANYVMRMGESSDTDFIRQTLVRDEYGKSRFDLSQVEASSFAAITDSLVALSKSYFGQIPTDIAAGYAEQLYTGNQTIEGIEQMFKEQAERSYPMLANALAAGITPEQYFAPYKYEMERILGRPNIDLYEEFPDVISHIAENGEMRPMTLNEVRRYARGLPEWQQSTQGKDSARALAFAIGEVFGEVA